MGSNKKKVLPRPVLLLSAGLLALLPGLAEAATTTATQAASAGSDRMVQAALSPGPATRFACPADIIPPELQHTRVVAFGEYHGTQEIPKLVGDYVCALAMQGHPVVLALEFDAAEQALFDAYLRSQGQPADIDRLLAGDQWQVSPDNPDEKRRGVQDGRASQAGLGLVERVRQLKAAGYPVSIVLFDDYTRMHMPEGASMDDNGRRAEEVMAEVMLEALAAHPDARFVVEAGGIHVATHGDPMNRPNYTPMGQRLRQAGIDIASLSAVYAGEHNTHWGCEAPDESPGASVTMAQIVCGASAGPTARPPTPFIRMTPYDGNFYVGATTMSPPARALQAVEQKRDALFAGRGKD